MVNYWSRPQTPIFRVSSCLARSCGTRWRSYVAVLISLVECEFVPITKDLEVCSFKYNFGLQLLSIPPFLCNVNGGWSPTVRFILPVPSSMVKQSKNSAENTCLSFCIEMVQEWKQRSQSGCWGVKLQLERGGKNQKGRRKGNGKVTTEKWRNGGDLGTERKERKYEELSVQGDKWRNGTGRGCVWLRN
jgi:hypothetical protein